MKTRHWLLGAGLVGAAALVLFDQPDAAPEPVAAPVAAGQARRTPERSALDQDGLAHLISRDELIGDETRFGQGGKGLFARQDWTPPPPPPPKPVPPPPPPPPTAPALPYSFIGKSLQDGVWEVYLARGDHIYLVQSGAVLDASYRVDAIAPPLLTLTYLPLNQVQQIHIGAFE